MKTFKLENLKAKARKIVQSANCNSKDKLSESIGISVLMNRMDSYSRELFDNDFDAFKSKCIGVINRWDARFVVQLTEAFPSIVPNKYVGAACTVDINENGDWVVQYGTSVK